jgi:hypothetical protein
VVGRFRGRSGWPVVAAGPVRLDTCRQLRSSGDLGGSSDHATDSAVPRLRSAAAALDSVGSDGQVWMGWVSAGAAAVGRVSALCSGLSATDPDVRPDRASGHFRRHGHEPGDQLATNGKSYRPLTAIPLAFCWPVVFCGDTGPAQARCPLASGGRVPPPGPGPALTCEDTSGKTVAASWPGHRASGVGKGQGPPQRPKCLPCRQANGHRAPSSTLEGCSVRKVSHQTVPRLPPR